MMLDPDILDNFSRLVREAAEEIEKMVETLQAWMDDNVYMRAEEEYAAHDLEWERERQREARLHDRDRARARYKAHCIRMTAQKARKHLRRRKYRSGANAGVW